MRTRLPFPDVCQDREIAQLFRSWSELHTPSNSIYANRRAACILCATVEKIVYFLDCDWLMPMRALATDIATQSWQQGFPGHLT